MRSSGRSRYDSPGERSGKRRSVRGQTKRASMASWRHLNEISVRKTDVAWMLFLLDQTALSIVCHQMGAATTFLPATYNWLCHLALPMASDDGSTLLRPEPPHEPLGIIHQASETKRVFFSLQRFGGGRVSPGPSAIRHIRSWPPTIMFCQI